jgi:DNA-binding transcriptional LysR family regulator
LADGLPGAHCDTLAVVNLFEGYRYLVALAQHRHFGRAAAACHITQPALSNALRALESHFGVAIVRRGRAYGGLTAEGQEVLVTAHRVLHEQEVLAQSLASAVARPVGRLSVGSVPTAVPVAARFCAAVVAAHPGLAPQLRSLSSQDLETGLEDLTLDLAFGFVDRSAANGRLDAWLQYEEHHYLVEVAPTQHAPAGPGPGQGQVAPASTPATWAEAATRALCLLTPEMHHRALVDEVFQRLGCQVRPVIETDSVLALAVAVRTGGLAAVLPGALVATLPREPGLTVRPLVEPELRTGIGLTVLAAGRPSRALQAAVELARSPQWLAQARAVSGTFGG